MNIESKDILIRMLKTPNPYALKFVLNCPLKNQGRASFYSKEDSLKLPLIRALFDIPGLKQIFVFQNQMTLTHDGSLSEEAIEKQTESIVKTRIVLHDPNFLSVEEEQSSNSVNISNKKNLSKEMSPKLLEVEKILDRTVRPGLRADGGDLEVLSVKNNEVKISYQGACGGCPSAFMGTLEAIEGILQQEMDCPELRVTPIE